MCSERRGVSGGQEQGRCRGHQGLPGGVFAGARGDGRQFEEECLRRRRRMRRGGRSVRSQIWDHAGWDVSLFPSYTRPHTHTRKCLLSLRTFSSNSASTADRASADTVLFKCRIPSHQDSGGLKRTRYAPRSRSFIASMISKALVVLLSKKRHSSSRIHTLIKLRRSFIGSKKVSIFRGSQTDPTPRVHTPYYSANDTQLVRACSTEV